MIIYHYSFYIVPIIIKYRTQDHYWRFQTHGRQQISY